MWRAVNAQTLDKRAPDRVGRDPLGSLLTAWDEENAICLCRDSINSCHTAIAASPTRSAGCAS